MIIHISIPAFDTLNVARVMADICQGEVKPFSPLNNAYMVYANDEYSTGFEIYPADIELQPGKALQEPSCFTQLPKLKRYSTTHCALSTGLTKEQIQTLAKQEKWRCIYTRRADAFNVFEFWLENHFLLELITKEDLAEAKEALKSDGHISTAL